ncbi:MAG TPA: lysophospholipid acyltransferase family protein [Candidatus Dormibacteraeota bacterium]|nr:lysophospholipid acyltransferase family protein [Candidatus Dormibacteraeota bacterium]
MLYPILRAVMHLLRRIFLFTGLHVDGLEKVPKSGPVLVVGNHIASLDPPLTGALIKRFDVYYMAKSEYFVKRWQRWLFKGYNAFPVVRHSADRTSLKQALSILRDGHVLMMYPEGTRSVDLQVHRPYAGAGFLARKSAAPIVPVAVWGSEGVLPKGASWPRHDSEVHIRFGDPFLLPERNADGTRMDHQQSADYMMARVAAMLPERYRGVFGPGGDVSAASPAA